MATKTITFRLSEDMHKKLKIKVAQEGRKIQEYIAELIEKDIGKCDKNKTIN